MVAKRDLEKIQEVFICYLGPEEFLQGKSERQKMCTLGLRISSVFSACATTEELSEKLSFVVRLVHPTG
jgi:hypothetical protein